MNLIRIMQETETLRLGRERCGHTWPPFKARNGYYVVCSWWLLCLTVFEGQLCDTCPVYLQRSCWRGSVVRGSRGVPICPDTV